MTDHHDPEALPDWAGALLPERFESSARYDALNRVVQSVAPHSSTRGRRNRRQWRGTR